MTAAADPSVAPTIARAPSHRGLGSEPETLIRALLDMDGTRVTQRVFGRAYDGTIQNGDWRDLRAFANTRERGQQGSGLTTGMRRRAGCCLLQPAAKW